MANMSAPIHLVAMSVCLPATTTAAKRVVRLAVRWEYCLATTKVVPKDLMMDDTMAAMMAEGLVVQWAVWKVDCWADPMVDYLVIQ